MSIFERQVGELVYFAACVQRDELQSRAADFDSADGVRQQFVVDAFKLFEARTMSGVGGIVDVRDLLDSRNML